MFTTSHRADLLMDLHQHQNSPRGNQKQGLPLLTPI